MTNNFKNEKEITFEQNDQMEMVVMSTTDPKEEGIGKTCNQDKLEMVVTPQADQNELISNGKKEEKIGTTCHQCRQKIKGLSAHCTNKKKDKPCPNKFCHKCLINRYGEQAKEKSVLVDWSCPKCRGICNCSICMKSRGHKPTGILVHTAKANGFLSVSELLSDQGPKALSPKRCSKCIQNNDALEFNKEPCDDSSSNVEKENTDGICSCINSNPGPSISTKKKNKRKHEELINLEDISFPWGAEMTCVAGINLPQKDVGKALQFLEFCKAFKEILDLQEGEPIDILLELIRGGNGSCVEMSPVIRFHILLLSTIQKDLINEYVIDKCSWLRALQNCLSKSQHLLHKLELDGIHLEGDGYESLSSSTRLRILAFLCDEVLCTVKFKSWIDDQNVRVKLSKKRLTAAIQKEKQLRLKLENEVRKAEDVDNLSKSEHEVGVSEIKNEMAEAHSEVLEAESVATNEKQRYQASRTEILISDINGNTYFKLKGYADDSNIFLRDETWDGIIYKEKWLTLDAQQAKDLEECVSALKEIKVSGNRMRFFNRSSLFF